MPSIRRLSPHVVNQIAAGEVIERPASVVKELMENSIDAGARRIDVEIERGGTELIRITDDGCGIAFDELPLAIASHATSKLETADDLFRVHTMGFRGEAVASIAEVSHLQIRSQTRDAASGGEIRVLAGEASPTLVIGTAPGTQIEVRELFVSVPVRRKFLKKDSTEFGHIAEQFLRLALAHPALHLTLRNNGKGVHDLPPGGLSERLARLHGSLAAKLISVDASAGEARLYGYVAPPDVSKSSRRSQYLFLNGRYIQDRSLQHALGEAYRGLLMVGRHPVSFLYLELPPGEVDVNVHPTKSEVRFRDSSTLYRLLLQTLRAKFLQLDFQTAMDARGLRAEPTDRQMSLEPTGDLRAREELAAWAKQALEKASEANSRLVAPAEAATPAEPFPRDQPRPANGHVPVDPPEAATTPLNSNDNGSLASHPPEAEAASGAVPAVLANTPPIAEAAREAVGQRQPPTHVLQVHDTYLVFETERGLTVIDQHALHERVMYEQLRPRVLNGTVEVQRLLLPVPVEMSAEEAALLADHESLLAELGLEVAGFGGATVLVSGYPSLLTKADPAELLATVVESLQAADRKATRRDLADHLLQSMACKAAIKAGQRLASEEIAALMALRHLVDDAHHCPHGRPTALTLSRDELDRQFGRLG